LAPSNTLRASSPSSACPRCSCASAADEEEEEEEEADAEEEEEKADAEEEDEEADEEEEEEAQASACLTRDVVAAAIIVSQVHSMHLRCPAGPKSL
jgi:hypothetical protein